MKSQLSLLVILFIAGIAECKPIRYVGLLQKSEFLPPEITSSKIVPRWIAEPILANSSWRKYQEEKYEEGHLKDQYCNDDHNTKIVAPMHHLKKQYGTENFNRVLFVVVTTFRDLTHNNEKHIISNQGMMPTEDLRNALHFKDERDFALATEIIDQLFVKKTE